MTAAFDYTFPEVSYSRHAHKTNLLVNVETEEQVLSMMMWGTVVTSLALEDFTTPLRQTMYWMLSSGVEPKALLGTLRESGHLRCPDDGIYVRELFKLEELPPKAMREAVADLKRLNQVRQLAECIDHWRRQLPHLDIDVAKQKLATILEALRRDP